MKTRIGFVSNSSVSSFVIFTNQKVLDDVLGSFTQDQSSYIKKLIKEPVKTMEDGHIVFLGSIDLSELSHDALTDEVIFNFFDKINADKNSFTRMSD